MLGKQKNGEKMRLIIACLVNTFFIFSCGTTQQLHFADVSSVAFTLPKQINILGTSDDFVVRQVKGGDYSKVGEFSDYSWHVFLEGGYEGFRKLPYKNPDNTVHQWIHEILEKNGRLAQADSGHYLDIYVQKMKLKTQKSGAFDYRACLVKLNVAVTDNTGKIVSQGTIEGVAKLENADISVVERNIDSVVVKFGPDEPSVCSLAIVKGLSQ